MEITELSEPSAEWRAFLETDEAQVFHTPEWGAFIAKTFPGTKHRCLAATESGKIRLIFPLTEVRSRIFGDKIISCAFMDYGGPAGDTAYIGQMLAELEKRYATAFDYLEIHRGLQPAWDIGKAVAAVGGKRFVTALNGTEKLWAGISKQKRKAVRKAEESGITVRQPEEGEIKGMYALYLAAMKDFGSPPYPISFFQNFYEIFVRHGLGRVFGAYSGDKLVAVLVGFTYKKRIHIIINVSDRRFWDMRPNDILHWEFLKWGCENGYETFDWGRSRTSVAAPPNFFKRMWATTEEDFPYYYMLWKVKDVPNTDPDGQKYRLLVKAWRRLPVALTRGAGARIRGGLGV